MNGKVTINKMSSSVYKEEYFYIKHGLLYIVYLKTNNEFGPYNIEDSRWKKEKKAKKHCEKLNIKINNHG